MAVVTLAAMAAAPTAVTVVARAPPLRSVAAMAAALTPPGAPQLADKEVAGAGAWPAPRASRASPHRQMAHPCGRRWSGRARPPLPRHLGRRLGRRRRPPARPPPSCTARPRPARPRPPRPRPASPRGYAPRGLAPRSARSLIRPPPYVRRRSLTRTHTRSRPLAPSLSHSLARVAPYLAAHARARPPAPTAHALARSSRPSLCCSL